MPLIIQQNWHTTPEASIYLDIQQLDANSAEGEEEDDHESAEATQKRLQRDRAQLRRTYGLNADEAYTAKNRNSSLDSLWTVKGVLSREFRAHASVGQQQRQQAASTSQPNKSNTAADLAAKQQLLLGRWRVRIHGKAGTGKSSISAALCRLPADARRTHADSPGMDGQCLIMPIKLEDDDDADINEVRWVMLQLESTGGRIQEQFSYLKYPPDATPESGTQDQDSSVDRFDAHIVTFSMTDRDSMQAISSMISALRRRFPKTKIVAVGTKIDDFQNYQVTNVDVMSLCDTCNVPVCLVNCLTPLNDRHSAYLIVQELAELLY